MKLQHDLSEENYDSKFSASRFWVEVGAAHGGVSNHRLYNNILSCGSMKFDLITTPRWGNQILQFNNKSQYMPTGQLIHNNVRLLLMEHRNYGTEGPNFYDQDML